jgi:anti-sigma factor RsiW
MSMHHPLDKLSAAVDGELDHDARDRIFSHLVGCESCRAEADAQRRLKAQLGTVDCPEPSSDLMQRLLGVPAFSAEPREEIRPVVTPAISLSPARSVFPAARNRAASRPAPQPARPAARSGRSRRRGVVVGAAGSAAAVASLLGTAFVIGEPAQQQPPTLQPPLNSFSADHASTTAGYPFGDPAAMLPAFSTTLTGSTGTTVVQPAATGR